MAFPEKKKKKQCLGHFRGFSVAFFWANLRVLPLEQSSESSPFINEKKPHVPNVFLPSILRPELAVPFYGRLGFGVLFFCREASMPQKFLVSGGGG